MSLEPELRKAEISKALNHFQDHRSRINDVLSMSPCWIDFDEAS
jgi:hypothetical protein